MKNEHFAGTTFIIWSKCCHLCHKEKKEEGRRESRADSSGRRKHKKSVFPPSQPNLLIGITRERGREEEGKKEGEGNKQSINGTGDEIPDIFLGAGGSSKPISGRMAEGGGKGKEKGMLTVYESGKERLGMKKESCRRKGKTGERNSQEMEGEEDEGKVLELSPACLPSLSLPSFFAVFISPRSVTGEGRRKERKTISNGERNRSFLLFSFSSLLPRSCSAVNAREEGGGRRSDVFAQLQLSSSFLLLLLLRRCLSVKIIQCLSSFFFFFLFRIRRNQEMRLRFFAPSSFPLREKRKEAPSRSLSLFLQRL